MYKPTENLYEKLSEPTLTAARKQDLQCLGERQSAVSCLHLKLTREHKEDYMKVEERKVGIGLQDS